MSEKIKTPLIISISGPSLSGKTEFTKELIKTNLFYNVISYTDRKPRKFELNGVDYYFVERFNHKEMIQKTFYNGFNYGVCAHEVQTKLDKPLLWVIAPQSLTQIESYVQEKKINLLKVFISNPKEILLERFLERFKNDTSSDVEVYSKRLLSMFNEEQNWETDYKYDLKIKNFTSNNKAVVLENFLEYLGLEVGKKPSIKNN